MEGANFFTNSNDIENEYKKEKEALYKKNHSKLVKNYVQSRRTLDSFPANKTAHKCIGNRLSLPSDLNDLYIDPIKIMDEIITLQNKLLSLEKKNNLFNFKNDDKGETKRILLDNLKKLRKELSKENIPVTKMINIINNNIQYLVEVLTELLNYNSDDYLKSETLWIINNIMYFIAKHKENNIITFDSIKIMNILCNYLNKYMKDKNPKCTLIEKIFRIFGNLIYIDSNVIKIIIHNKILSLIIDCLGNPVSSFRTTCLWLLNKIILTMKKNNDIDYIPYFVNQDAISNYRCIFSRSKNNISLDEISELFWLICELVKHYSNILIPIFFSKNNNINNVDNIDNELALNNFSFILDNCMTNKMTQVCIRLISNILVVCYDNIKSEYLLTKFIENFYEKQVVVLSINDVLNSPKNKYDISLVKDVLLLIFNLICISPIKSSIFFKKGIVNLISDRDYHVNKEVMKLLFLTFYRILNSVSLTFEPNDEKVVRTCLTVIKRFKDDEDILIIFNDIFYYYLKASKTYIDNEIETEFIMIKNNNSSNILNYNSIFTKLADIIKMYSPLSKFMRNK